MLSLGVGEAASSVDERSRVIDDRLCRLTDPDTDTVTSLLDSCDRELQ